MRLSQRRSSNISASQPGHLWVYWSIYSMLGAALGWLLAIIVGFSTFFVGFLAGGVFVGIALGWLQGKVLELNNPTSKLQPIMAKWRTATIKGGGFGFFAFLLLYLAAPYFYMLRLPSIWVSTTEFVGIVIGSTILGIFQERVLREYTPSSIWWIPVNTVGWSVGALSAHLLIDPLLQRLPSPDGTFATGHVALWYLACVGATLVSSIITGTILPRMSIPSDTNTSI
jgi:hypothetical protein